MCVVLIRNGLVFLAHNKANRLAISQKEEKREMTIWGLGPLEIIWSLTLFTYMSYNVYIVWRDSDGDMEY